MGVSVQTSRREGDPLRVVGRRLMLVGILILIAIAIQAVWNAYRISQESQAMRAQADMRVGELRSREAALRADIASLKSERGMEEALRESYGFGKAGEGVLIIVETTEGTPPEKESWSERFFFWR